ncbi:MAG: hypothetical protein HUU01_15385 [Saprospiraceae bacterium]|nr:hypothetical protein [Saprospiraceae bacterium]
MMNTWNFFDNVFTNKVDQAIIALEAMSNETGSVVMDFLLEHQTATELDLLVQTRLDAGALDCLLTTLGTSGIVLQKASHDGMYYQADLAKIGRIRQVVALINQPLMNVR